MWRLAPIMGRSTKPANGCTLELTTIGPLQKQRNRKIDSACSSVPRFCGSQFSCGAGPYRGRPPPRRRKPRAPDMSIRRRRRSWASVAPRRRKHIERLRPCRCCCHCWWCRQPWPWIQPRNASVSPCQGRPVFRSSGNSLSPCPKFRCRLSFRSNRASLVIARTGVVSC